MTPSECSHPLAARLLHISEKRLGELVAEGLLSTSPDSRGCRRRYLLDDLAFLLGRPITDTDWLRADGEHDRRRVTYRKQNNRRAPFNPPTFLRATAT
jgi:hypothetical protein